MRYLILLASFLLAHFCAHAQKLKPNWVNDLGGVSGYSQVRDVAVDKQNNVYIVGDFNSETIDFDPGVGVNNLKSDENSDIFVGKYKQDGTLVWVKLFVSTASQSNPDGIAVDKDGNVSITGEFAGGTIDADPGPGVFNLIANGQDGFVIHLDNNGDLLWAHSTGTFSWEGGYQVVTDSQNNVIVTSTFGRSFTIGDSTYSTPKFSYNGLVTKYGPAGNVIWAVRIGNGVTANQGAIGCGVDSQDNIIISGLFSNTVNFNPLGKAVNVTASSADESFIAKYSPSGGLIWVNGINATLSNLYALINSRIGIDRQNNVYFTTNFLESITFGSSVTLNSKGRQDVCIAKYSPTGVLQYAKQIGGPDANAQNFKIVSDNKSNIYLTGYFSGTINFNPNLGTAENLSAGGQGIGLYVAEYDPTGNYIYAFNSGNPVCGNTLGLGLAVDNNNNLDVGGQFCSTVNFDPSGCLTDNITAKSINRDGVFAQYSSAALANNTITAPMVTSFCGVGTPDAVTGSVPTGGNGAYTYQWQSSTDSVKFADISGAIGQNYPPPAITATTYFQRIASSGTCTDPVTSNVVILTIANPPDAPVVPSVTTCAGNTATLSVASPQQSATYNWYTSTTSDTLLFTGGSFTTPALTADVTYYVGAVNSVGCISVTRTPVAVVILQPLAVPIVTAGATTSTSVSFSWAAVPGASGYQVSTDGGQTYSAPSSGLAGLTDTVGGLQGGESVTIIVQAAGAIACQLSATSTAVTSMAISPTNDVIYVPNAFTPNGDGKNDRVHVHAENIQSLKFYVYDQWGELLFSSTDPLNGWDGTYKGKREPDGVYVYYLQAVMNDGHKVNKKGTITLLK